MKLSAQVHLASKWQTRGSNLGLTSALHVTQRVPQWDSLYPLTFGHTRRENIALTTCFDKVTRFYIFLIHCLKFLACTLSFTESLAFWFFFLIWPHKVPVRGEEYILLSLLIQSDVIHLLLVNVFNSGNLRNVKESQGACVWICFCSSEKPFSSQQSADERPWDGHSGIIACWFLCIQEDLEAITNCLTDDA